MAYSKKQIKGIFAKAAPVKGKNPDLYRKDDLGNLIYLPSYGKNSPMGFEIDHKRPKSKGGSDHNRNLRPLQTSENRRKSNKYPHN